MPLASLYSFRDRQMRCGILALLPGETSATRDVAPRGRSPRCHPAQLPALGANVTFTFEAFNHSSTLNQGS